MCRDHDVPRIFYAQRCFRPRRNSEPGATCRRLSDERCCAGVSGSDLVLIMDQIFLPLHLYSTGHFLLFVLGYGGSFLLRRIRLYETVNYSREGEGQIDFCPARLRHCQSSTRLQRFL